MKAVSLKFNDPSISVREAAISIVGSYVAQLPAAADSFHSSLLPCLNDPGVSVRKRTVRVLQDMLLSNLPYTERASACAELLTRAADPKEDDGVRDLIHELFLKLWLEDGESEVVESEVVDQSLEPCYEVVTYESKVLDFHCDPTSPGAEVVTPTPHKPKPTRLTAVLSPSKETLQSRRRGIGDSKKVCSRAKVAAEQMVEVVKASGSCDTLAFLLRELLRDESDADKTRKTSERLKRQDAAKKRCSKLSEALFDRLVHVDEQRTSFGDGFGNQLVSVMRAISMIAEFSPDSVQSEIDTILPYLKMDNGVTMEEESAIATACCDILFQVTPYLNEQSIESLASQKVGGDLVSITHKFGSNALSSAVRALSALAQRAGSSENNAFGKNLFSLAKSFYGYLAKVKDSTTNFSTSLVSCEAWLNH
jgi:cohesin loading factor subunit SCC2